MPHEGVRVAQHRCRNHFRGGVVPEEKDRQPVVLAALGDQHLFQDLPACRVVLGAIDRDEPAGLGVEHVHEPPGVLIGDAPDHSKTLLLDRLREASHAPTSRALSVEVLVDDRYRKGTLQFHGNPPLWREPTTLSQLDNRLWATRIIWRNSAPARTRAVSDADRLASDRDLIEDAGRVLDVSITEDDPLVE